MLSRVADSLYWMSRYIERAENSARMLDVNVQLALDVEHGDRNRAGQLWQPILSSLEENELFERIHQVVDGDTVVDFVVFEEQNPNSICSCLGFARENARTVREQISMEMWEQLNRLHLYICSSNSRRDYQASPYEFFKTIAEGSQLFQGITDSTMSHGEGWDFIQIGKYLERADLTSRILDIKYHLLLPLGERVGGTIDTTQWESVLKSCSGLEAYRKLYVGQLTPSKIAEFLITSDQFPRSIRFCVDHLDSALHRVSGCPRSHFTNEAERLSGRLCSSLDYATIGDVISGGMHQYLDATQTRLQEVGSAMHQLYCEWMSEETGGKPTAS